MATSGCPVLPGHWEFMDGYSLERLLCQEITQLSSKPLWFYFLFVCLLFLPPLLHENHLPVSPVQIPQSENLIWSSDPL